MRVALMTAALLITSCAGSNKSTPRLASQSPAEQSDDVPGDERHSQIETLSRQILDMQSSPAFAIPTASATRMAEPGATKEQACLPQDKPTVPVCLDLCRLAEAICDNAGKICHLAEQLGNDPWAAGKCTRANESCEAARKHCCLCGKKADPTGVPTPP